MKQDARTYGGRTIGNGYDEAFDPCIRVDANPYSLTQENMCHIFAAGVAVNFSDWLNSELDLPRQYGPIRKGLPERLEYRCFPRCMNRQDYQ